MKKLIFLFCLMTFFAMQMLPVHSQEMQLDQLQLDQVKREHLLLDTRNFAWHEHLFIYQLENKFDSNSKIIPVSIFLSERGIFSCFFKIDGFSFIAKGSFSKERASRTLTFTSICQVSDCNGFLPQIVCYSEIEAKFIDECQLTLSFKHSFSNVDQETKFFQLLMPRYEEAIGSLLTNCLQQEHRCIICAIISAIVHWFLK